jgi:hypothetical protein
MDQFSLLILRGKQWNEINWHLKNTVAYSTDGNECYVYPIIFSNVDCALYLSDFTSELREGTIITMFKMPWF